MIKLGVALLVVLTGSALVEIGVPAFMPPPATTVMLLRAAAQDIPPEYQALIARWAAAYGIDWSVLAGVLKVECDFGRSCGTSPAGAVGPARFEPGTWAVYGVDGDSDGRKDPLDPADAVASAASYLHALGASPAGGVRAALCHYNAGASPAFQACMDGTQSPDYADLVLGWAARYRASEAGAGSLPVVLPIPAPGWGQRIATPLWPPDLAAHMSPSGVTNQCVAGALASWAVAHAGDARWNHPPPLAGNAIDLFDLAVAERFTVSRQPAAGSMVVYGGSYGLFGHVATVVAVRRAAGHDASGEAPGWPTLYRHFPGIIVVLANAGRANLQRRLASLLALCRADPELGSPDGVSVSFVLFEELMARGPFTPIFWRLEGERPVDWLGQ